MGKIWLLSMPDVLRQAGLNVQTWPGWQTRSRGSGGYDSIMGVGIHHDASPTGTSLQNRCVYAWQNAGDKPIGAMFLHTDGSVIVGAAGATNTQGKGGPYSTSRGTIAKNRANWHVISIEASNNGLGEAWPEVMQDAYVVLCRALCEWQGLDPGRDVIAHFEWAPGRKFDPAGPSRYATGKALWDMDRFRADVADQPRVSVTGGAGGGGGQAPDYRNGDYGLQPLDFTKPTLRRGSPDTGHKVRYLQGVLKNAAGEHLDIGGNEYGTFGPPTEQSVKNVQTRFGITADGIVDWDGPDGKSPGSNSTWTIIDQLAAGTQPEDKPPAPTRPPAEEDATATSGAQHGALAAARAAHRAGFDGEDLITITLIGGRESRWRADAVNPNTSDRGMWQINWATLKKAPYEPLRQRLGITTDTDLLDLETNAAVAWQMYQDSIAQKRPWHPWRGSEKGWNGNGPGWDGNGDHLWRTDEHRQEATAAATAVLPGDDTPDTPTPPPAGGAATAGANERGTYTITDHDSDGFVAVVSRCVGTTDAPWATRKRVAEAVAAHNGVALDKIWHPGEAVRFPPTIDGIRSYSVKPADGLIAIATGLGLGRDTTAQQRVTAINAWQGATPHPGDTWYGGTAS